MSVEGKGAEVSPEMEGEPLGRAWPLCGSDLSQSSHALALSPHHGDEGGGVLPGPCGKLLLLSTGVYKLARKTAINSDKCCQEAN